MIEQQSRYIGGLIDAVLDARKQGQTLSLTPRKEKVDAYNAKLQQVLQNSAFNDPNCNSWYKNEAGLITNNWSGTVIEYQNRLSSVEYGDYEAEGSGKTIAQKRQRQKIGRVVEETQFSDKALLTMGLLSTVALVGGFLFRNTRYLNALRVK